MDRVWLVPILAALVSACAGARSVSEPTNPLERALHFREISRNGEAYDLSVSSSGAFGVPNGAQVDINSTIEIHIDKDQVKLPDLQRAPQAEGYPAKKAQEIRDALQLLAHVVEARANTARAYTEGQDAYLTARRISNPLSRKFSLLPIWTDGTLTASVEEVNQAVERDKTYRLLGPILQQQLDRMQAELDSAEAVAKSNAAQFKMAAFIQSPNGDPSAIHLPNYDSLDQRDASFKDAFLMDQQDMATLKAQWSQTQAIAKAAEDLRTQKASINSTLKAAGLNQLTDVVAAAEQVQALSQQDWPAFVRGLGSDLKTAAEVIERVAKERGDAYLRGLAAKAGSADTQVLSDLPIEKVQSLSENLGALESAWHAASPDGIPNLIDRTQELAGETSSLANELLSTKLTAARDAVSSLAELAATRPSQVSPETWATLTDELDKSGALTRVRTLVAIVDALKQLKVAVNQLTSLLASNQAVGITLKAPMLDVAWSDAMDSRVELPRTSRAIDDKLQITSVLSLDGKEWARSDASFTVQQFGWHKSISPSVILARPWRTTSSFDRDFKFAPAVSWLATFYPRPSENGLGCRFARVSQFGLGLHAAFLNQDPQNNAEIGLGAAVSAWGDFLTAGLGWNLMSDSRPYIYVGTNLIPILQSLGYGRGTQAGRSP